jgi:hypothetical protein
MTPPDAPVPPSAVVDDSAGPSPTPTPSLPKYPRQTPAGYYGPRQHGPNAFALVSFVSGLGGGVPLSVTFACIALAKIRDTGQSGRGFAIAGLVLSALWLPAEILLAVRRISGR